ncbi:UNVERIFIED_CONTAM: hypothetical protein K2H54_046155, partial [Gekko kuhli]
PFGTRAGSHRGGGEGSQACGHVAADAAGPWPWRPETFLGQRKRLTSLGRVEEPVEQQPEVCMVLQTTPEASAADVSASEHEGPTRSPVMQPVDAPPAAAAGGERPVPATDMSGPTAAEEPTVQSLAAQLAGHVAQTDRRFDRILYLLDLQQKAFRRLNRDVSQLRHTLGLPPAATPTDSEGPCSDGGTTARGDLPLASPIMASAGPPVQSAPTAPPGAGPSTSHDM